MHVLRDTSNLAPAAVEDLTTEGGSLTDFRYRVRLGVGKHLSQFVWFLLPFYVNLKPYAYLLSLLIGVVFGHLFLFVVFKCRIRFQAHRGRVAAVAAVFMSIVSALVFTAGMYVVEQGWVSSVNGYLCMSRLCRVLHSSLIATQRRKRRSGALAIVLYLAGVVSCNTRGEVLQAPQSRRSWWQGDTF